MADLERAAVVKNVIGEADIVSRHHNDGFMRPRSVGCEFERIIIRRVNHPSVAEGLAIAHGIVTVILPVWRFVTPLHKGFAERAFYDRRYIDCHCPFTFPFTTQVMDCRSCPVSISGLDDFFCRIVEGALGVR